MIAHSSFFSLATAADARPASGPPVPAPRCRARSGSAPDATASPTRASAASSSSPPSGTRLDLTGVVLESGDSVSRPLRRDRRSPAAMWTASRWWGARARLSRRDPAGRRTGTPGHRLGALGQPNDPARVGGQPGAAGPGAARGIPGVRHRSDAGPHLVRRRHGRDLAGKPERHQPARGAGVIPRGQRPERQQRVGDPALACLPERHRAKPGGSHGALRPAGRRLRRRGDSDPRRQRFEHGGRQRPHLLEHRPPPGRRPPGRAAVSLQHDLSQHAPPTRRARGSPSARRGTPCCSTTGRTARRSGSCCGTRPGAPSGATR